MKPGNVGIKRLVSACGYSWKGLCAAWRHEAAFRQELLLLCLLTPLALWAPVTPLEKLTLIGALVALVVVELLNSAIEAVVDKTGSELHPLSGRAKDMGSAAVLLTLLMAIATWVVIWMGVL